MSQIKMHYWTNFQSVKFYDVVYPFIVILLMFLITGLCIYFSANIDFAFHSECRDSSSQVSGIKRGYAISDCYFRGSEAILMEHTTNFKFPDLIPKQIEYIVIRSV